MRVALDARTMQAQPRGGIGRALANLLPELAAEVDLVLLTAQELPPLDSDLEQVGLPTPLRGVSASWLQISAVSWLRTSGVDVFHCPFYALPYRLPVPGVATLHDLTFEHFPYLFTRRHLWSFRLQARHAARVARVLLTVTEYVKQDVVGTYGVAPERVLVTKCGADPVFTPNAADRAFEEKLGLRRPYLVALGGASRRNLPLAVRAWARANTGHQLAVVGSETPDPDSGAKWLGPIDDPAWAAVLAGAAGFLYPTYYEGFGMPAFEAQASGTPVIAAPTSSLPEVLGGVAAWAGSLDEDSLVAALSAFVADGAKQAQLRQAGLEHVRIAPGYRHSAQVHLEAYRRAASAG